MKFISKISLMAFAAVLCPWANQPASAQKPGSSTSSAPDFHQWTPTPPMGWNSWDCFGPAVTEQQVLANADYVAKHLKSHGWDLITIDGQWARTNPQNNQNRAGALLEMDDYGRLLPAATRFPSTKATRSFKPIADAIHARGLKLGLHLLRGIPRLAVSRNVPILGTSFHAANIADTTSICPWSIDIWGIDASKPGAQAYYDSVFALLASWDVDFVKVDNLTPPYRRGEIEAIRKAIDKTGRRIVLSTSPGPVPPMDEAHIAAHANLWRISGDFWDNWPALYTQFSRLNQWSGEVAPGKYADPDMLPLGSLRAWQPKKPQWTRFTPDEQVTLMTLWSIARSPLIAGADLPKNDAFTLSLMTNDEVIAVDQHSLGNHQVYRRGEKVVWMADAQDSADRYVALFNINPAPQPKNAKAARSQNPAATQPVMLSVSLRELGLSGRCRIWDLWTHRDLGEVSDEISAMVPSHGAVLYRVHPLK